MNAPRLIVSTARPVPGQEPSSFLRQFLFSANLQTQDLTGDPLLSESADSLIKELKSTPVKDTIILGLCDQSASSDSLGFGHQHGFPALPSTIGPDATDSTDPLPPTLGFVHASIPLDTNEDVLCCEIILDAEILPMPEEQLDEYTRGVLAELLDACLALSSRLNRPAVQLWLRCPVETSTLHEALVSLLEAQEFEHVYTDIHGHIPADAVEPQEFIAGEPTPVTIGELDVQALSYREQDVPESILPGVLELFDQGDTDVPTGALVHTPRKWTPERVRTAHQITLDRGDKIVSTVLLASGVPVAITDVALPAFSDHTAGEQTFTLVHRDFRGKGLGRVVKSMGLARARFLWPQVEKFYCDSATNNHAMHAVNQSVGFVGGASTVVYQKVMRPSSR